MIEWGNETLPKYTYTCTTFGKEAASKPATSTGVSHNFILWAVMIKLISSFWICDKTPLPTVVESYRSKTNKLITLCVGNPIIGPIQQPEPHTIILASS